MTSRERKPHLNECPRCGEKGKRSTVDNFALYRCLTCRYEWARHIPGRNP